MAFVEKRGPRRWRARYRGPDSRERSRTFERRIDAERFLTEQEGRKLRGEWTDPTLGQITLADWVATWERTTVDLRPTTRALNLGVVGNYLLPRFGDWPIAAIGPADVSAMVAEEVAAGELSTSAVRRHVLVLSSILGAAVAEGRIARNPCAGVRMPAERSRRMRFLDAEQLVGLAEAAGPHYRPLVLTAGLVGLRWGELAGLRVERVDLMRRKIRVEEQLLEVGGAVSLGPPKTRAGRRTVTVPGALTDVLAEHFASSPVERSGLAFPTPSGGSMRRSNFRRTFRRACVAAGFDPPPPKRGEPVVDPDPAIWPLAGLVFHELRHTAAALAIAAGAHPQAIKERLGHSSITVTLDRYGGLFPRLDEAIADGVDHLLLEALESRQRRVQSLGEPVEARVHGIAILRPPERLEPRQLGG